MASPPRLGRRLRWTLQRLLHAAVLRMPPLLVVAPGAITAFRRVHGRLPDLQAPRTFSEKILHRKLFDRRPFLTLFADKLAIRDHVADRIGDEFLPGLLHVADSAQGLPWTELPDRFVIKPTHGSGWVHIVTDRKRIDPAGIEDLCAYWLRQNYYVAGGEWAYRDIPPRLLIEEFLDDGSGQSPRDYKFFVFGGRVEYVQVDLDRFAEHRRVMFDRNGQRLDFRLLHRTYPGDVELPFGFGRMVELAEKLAVDVDFVRVDLYDCAGRIVFGEMTGTPENGLAPFDPPAWDLAFGQLWRMAR
jgi:hypothetical protein